MRKWKKRKQTNVGFSLIELMVSMGILTAILLMMTSLLSTIQKSWNSAESKLGQFREARVAFDLVSKNLSQATMNTYWDLEVDRNNNPEKYVKTSELHFITMPTSGLDNTKNFTMKGLGGHAIFFQAPLGSSVQYRNLNNLFTARGYFVAYGGDDSFKPSFIKSDPKYRFRLIEFRPPAEANQIFEDGLEERDKGNRQNFTKWFKQGGKAGGRFEQYLNPLAENIVMLVVAPRSTLTDPLKPNELEGISRSYQFDSNNGSPAFQPYSQQVPPLVRVTMIAIDETSALRLADGSTKKPPLEVLSAMQGKFLDPKKYDSDVEKVVAAFNKDDIGYKVFSTLVMLRSAKWSTAGLGGAGGGTP